MVLYPPPLRPTQPRAGRVGAFVAAGRTSKRSSAHVNKRAAAAGCVCVGQQHFAAVRPSVCPSGAGLGARLTDENGRTERSPIFWKGDGRTRMWREMDGGPRGRA